MLPLYILYSPPTVAGLSNSLLYALLKAAISSSPYQSFFPLPLMHYEDDEGNSREKRIMISRLKCFLPEEMPFNDNEIPFRYSWLYIRLFNFFRVFC